MAKRILIIDDDETSRFLYQHHFSRVSDIEIIAEFESAEDALEHIPRLKPDVAIVDYRLPGMSGAEFAEQLKQYPEIKVLLATSHSSEYVNFELKSSPNFDVVQKNWSKPVMESIFAFCR